MRRETTVETEALAWIGLGGNLGDVRTTLRLARQALAEISERPLRVSGVFGSEPWGPGPGCVEPAPDYLNQVVGVSMPFPQAPERLLASLLAIEARLGRTRSPGAPRSAPRPIDLDLLAYGEQAVDSPTLTLPHPRLSLRRFVLVPWAQVAPAFRVVTLGATVAELLTACPDRGRVWPLSD